MTQTTLHEASDFKKRKGHFKQQRDLFEGDQAILKDAAYLWPHELEKTKHGGVIRAIREQRSSYTNLIEPIVSMYVSLLFRGGLIVPDEVAALLGENIDNIDGKGTSFESFCRNEIAENYVLYGRPIVLVATLGEAPQTLADESTSFRPYFEIIHPLALVDYARESLDPKRINSLKFARIEYKHESERETPIDAVKVTMRSDLYWLENGALRVQTFEQVKDSSSKPDEDKAKWAPVGEPQEFPGLDEIPISLDLDSDSWIKDVCPHALKYYNLESTLDNICLYQAYQRIFVSSSEMEKDEFVTLAEYAIALIPADAKVQSVEPTSIEGPVKRLQDVLNNVFRIALNQTRQTAGESRAAESADTMREQKQMLSALIESEKEGLENVINHAVRLYAKHLGKEAPNEKVELNVPSQVDDVSIVSELVLAFKDDIMNLPLIKQETLKWYVNRINLDNKDELYKEIETRVVPARETGVNEQTSIRANLLRGLAG